MEFVKKYLGPVLGGVFMAALSIHGYLSQGKEILGMDAKWYVVAGIIGFAVAVFWLIKGVHDRLPKISSVTVGASEPGAIDPPVSPRFNPLDTYFSRQTIKISDLVDWRHPYVENKVFEDCIFHGPGVAMFIGIGALEHCGFDGDRTSFAMVADPSRPYIGPVAFKDCTLRRCKFRGIGVLAPKEFIGEFLAKMATK